MSDIETKCSIYDVVEKDGHLQRRKILELAYGIEEEDYGGMTIVVCDELCLRTGRNGEVDYYTCLGLSQMKQVVEFLRMAIAIAEAAA
jgi:hypothetical protein